MPERTFMCFTLARNSDPEGLVDLNVRWTVRNIEHRSKHFLVIITWWKCCSLRV